MNNIIDLNDIDTSTKEGKYLMAALAALTTESRRNQTPWEVLADLTILKDKMYERPNEKAV
jgi:hypothetical protein